MLFRPISYFKDAPEFAFASLDRHVTATPPRGTWPAAGGGPGRTGRSAEPLVHTDFTIAWQAPLGDAARPTQVLLGSGRIVVIGANACGIWTIDGRPAGGFARGLGATVVDVDGGRLLVGDAGGVAVHALDGRREAMMNAAGPSEGIARTIMQGPGAGTLVLVTTHEPPHGAARAVVETVRVRDYGDVKNRQLYGIEPLAGIRRDEDATVVAAAGRDGPVLATPNGVDWRDWQLRPRGELDQEANPIALSVDERGRTHLLYDDGGWTHLQILSSECASIVDLTLSPDDGAVQRPPLVAASGQITLLCAHAVVAISPDGQTLWRRPCAPAAAPPVATVCANGLLLVGGDTLDAVTSDGEAIPLAHLPAPVATPPVLANDHIYAATNDTLYALRPV